jgi:D-alanyl-D-alanine carboxypeptidase (penicillin-binding protein 5/6)
LFYTIAQLIVIINYVCKAPLLEKLKNIPGERKVNRDYRKSAGTIAFIVVVQLFLFLPQAGASQPLFKVDAHAAVLLDALSGQVIFEQNPQKKIAPASLVKILTLYLAYDALEMGLVKPDDKVLISKKAWATQGSKMFIEVGKRVELKKLLEGIASISGNDACVAVGEYLSGLEEAFVAKMNEKARSLGMINSLFKNVSGLPAKDQETTASDIGILSYHYLKDHPEALQIHSIKKFSFGGITQHNRNGLLWLDEGVDGLKTGWINDNAGFHLVATAKRDNQRFIAVVMGAKNQRTRENEAFKLLNYGFKNFSTVEMFKSDEPIATVEVWKGKSDQVALTAAGLTVLTIPIGEEKNLSLTKKIPERIFAPVNKSEKIGEMEITLNGELLKIVDLVAQDEVVSGNLITRVTHMALLSFTLQPYWGWVVLLLLLLLFILSRMITKKTR